MKRSQMLGVCGIISCQSILWGALKQIIIKETLSFFLYSRKSARGILSWTAASNQNYSVLSEARATPTLVFFKESLIFTPPPGVLPLRISNRKWRSHGVMEWNITIFQTKKLTKTDFQLRSRLKNCVNKLKVHSIWKILKTNTTK